MSWVGLLLVGLAVTDLVFSARPGRLLPQLLGVLAAVSAALLWGLTDWRDLAVLAGVVVAVLLWGLFVTRGFGRGPAWLPLVWLTVCLAAVLLAAPAAPGAGGLVGRWLEHAGAGLTPDRALLLTGLVLAQLSTGNVVVRLVLAATGTMNPARTGPDGRRLEAPPHSLKGGRLLGPMERVFIVGMGLAGQLTAASIVVAAKGLLRFPELQASRDAGDAGPGIHAVTEYFLVGSFASWLYALGFLGLALV